MGYTIWYPDEFTGIDPVLWHPHIFGVAAINIVPDTFNVTAVFIQIVLAFGTYTAREHGINRNPFTPL